VQKLRHSLDKCPGDTAHSKANKKVNLLHNALLIANWINNFDACSVNDCFDQQLNKLPVDLAHMEG